MIKSQDAVKAKERMLKVMQRPQNSMMQIDLSNVADKKRKRLPKKVVGAEKNSSIGGGAVKAKTPKRRGGEKRTPAKKTPVKRLQQGVRRNLTFDDGHTHSGEGHSPTKKRLKANACTPKKGGIKTPKKTPRKQAKGTSKSLSKYIKISTPSLYV